ncbi:DNA adenine methylase, partial [Candidatus Parcubacteria bacterium]
MSFWPVDQPDRVINVAQVRHLSPFRYPGGKTWFVPRVRRWLLSLPKRPRLFVEPFAGGAIVSLSVAAENLADQVLFVELDEQVAAVWQTILGEDADWLCDQILAFEMTAEHVDE